MNPSMQKGLKLTVAGLALAGILLPGAWAMGDKPAAPHVAVAQAPASKQITLAVDNMTCGTCPITVRKSLERLPGVSSVKTSLEPPEAVVVYNPARVSVEQLMNATKEAGYPSKPKG